MPRRPLKAAIAPALAAALSLAACRTVPELRLEAAAEPAEGYRIATWFRFAAAACSLTFDDGTLDQYLLAFPELEARGLKASFFLITGPRDQGWWNDSGTLRRLLAWEHARRMARAGQEIASHSMRHLDLTLDGAPVDLELRGSRTRLEREIRFHEGLVFGWPYWRSTEKARRRAHRYYIAARSGGAYAERYLESDSRPLATPRDFYGVGSLGALPSAANGEWLGVLDRTAREGGWLVAGFHGIDDGWIGESALGWEPLPIERFRGMLDYLAGREDLWIAPFGRVVRYIRERNGARLMLVERSADSMVFSLIDGLENAVYDQALTLELALPSGWPGAEVWQDRVLMPSHMRAQGRLVFDAFPRGSRVTLIRRAGPDVPPPIAARPSILDRGVLPN